MTRTLSAYALAGCALAAVFWSQAQSPLVAIPVVGLVAAVAAAVVVRAPLGLIGVGFVVVFSFVASWDNAAILGIKPRMIFMLLGLLLLGIGYGIKHPPPVPWWLHAYGVSAIIVTCLQVAFPIDAHYLNGRYATSAAGQSLGTRPGTLPSLLSLLFNNYAVPAVIVLACMYTPRALRWIITAYVTGVALSSIAGYLGYLGHPWLVDLVATPVTVGFRAQGFTSHSLHLATSEVMALALACWLALQPGWLAKWAGRISVPAMLLGLYASGSRGGTVAGVLALGLCAVLLPPVRRRLHVVTGAAMAGVAATINFVPAVGERILHTTRILGSPDTAVSDIGRGEVFQQGLSDFAHSPVFGIGVRYIAEAHVLYVGVLASGGLIFFLGYLLFNVGSFKAVRQGVEVDRALSGALLATLICSLFYWTVADDFQVASVEIIYGLVIAVASVRRSASAGENAAPVREPQPFDAGSDTRGLPGRVWAP